MSPSLSLYSGHKHLPNNHIKKNRKTKTCAQRRLHNGCQLGQYSSTSWQSTADRSNTHPDNPSTFTFTFTHNGYPKKLGSSISVKMQGANCKFANAGNANFPNLLPTAANNQQPTADNNNKNNKLFWPQKLNSKLAHSILRWR